MKGEQSGGASLPLCGIKGPIQDPNETALSNEPAETASLGLIALFDIDVKATKLGVGHVRDIVGVASQFHTHQQLLARPEPRARGAPAAGARRLRCRCHGAA